MIQTINNINPYRCQPFQSCKPLLLSGRRLFKRLVFFDELVHFVDGMLTIICIKINLFIIENNEKTYS